MVYTAKWEVKEILKYEPMPKRTVEEYIEELRKTNENADVKIKDKEGNEVTKGQIATGMTIEVNGQKVSTIIKAGDLDGNGKVNSIDSNMIKESRIGKRTLTEEEIKAADFNNDGRVNRIDAFILLYYRAQKIKDFSESTIKELMK